MIWINNIMVCIIDGTKWVLASMAQRHFVNIKCELLANSVVYTVADLN